MEEEDREQIRTCFTPAGRTAHDPIHFTLLRVSSPSLPTATPYSRLLRLPSVSFVSSLQSGRERK